MPVVPFAPRNGQLVAPAFEFLQVEDEVEHHRDARLPTVVSCAGWKCVKPSVGSSFHFSAKSAERVDDRGERLAQLVQALAHQDQVGVVGDVAGGRAEVDDVAAAGGHVPERVDVGHHVVPQPLLVLGGAAQVDVVEVGAEFGELLRPDARRLPVVGGQAEFGFGLGEREPEPPPGAELPQRPPPLAHRLRGVAADQRVVVDVVRCRHDLNEFFERGAIPTLRIGRASRLTRAVRQRRHRAVFILGFRPGRGRTGSTCDAIRRVGFRRQEVRPHRPAVAKE